MPRIKEVELGVKQQTHKFVIWYTEKEKFHVKGGLSSDMDDRVRGILKENDKYRKFDTAETLEKLRAQLQEFIELYWKAVESSHRVILISAEFSERIKRTYEVEAWGSPFDKDEAPRYHEERGGYRNEVYKAPRFNDHSYGGDSSLKIEFNWLIADIVKGAEVSVIEMQRNKSGEFVKCGKSFTMNKHNQSKYVVIDYTPEREQFFISLEEQFKVMADKMAAFISQSDEGIAALVDSKQLTLLPTF
jgi:hypothetical protein